MKKIICSSLAFCFLFSSCGDPSKVSENKNDSIPKTETISDPEIQKLVSLFKTEGTLPFVADTALINKVNTFDSLGTNEIKLLAGNFLKHDLISGVDYELNSFYKIDSLKAVKKYSEWCEHLDIGMTKCANAYALKKIKLNESTLVLIWSLCTSSYEACPFSVESSVYFTLVHDGKLAQSFLLGNSGSWGDPPSMMQCTITGILNSDGKFSLKLCRINDDIDAELRETTNEQYEFSISEGKINLVSEKKNEAIKSKTPKEKES